MHERRKKELIIDCISDLHGNLPNLYGGDLLIVAGDLTASHTLEEYHVFIKWMKAQDYRKKIVIAGNHDPLLQSDQKLFSRVKDFDYLCDSGIEFEGLKIWGTPWCLAYPFFNIRCRAFAITPEAIKEKWDLIPPETNILITHLPPRGILDRTVSLQLAGCEWLRAKIACLNEMELHVFGHIHENWGMLRCEDSIYVNASIVDERYIPCNHPIRVIL